MSHKEDLRKELKKTSPFLADFREKGDGFTVPKNYFKTLPDKVLERIGGDVSLVKTPAPQKESWLDEMIAAIQFLLQPRFAMALAGVLLLIFAGIFIFNQKNGQNSIAFNTATIPIEEISYEEMKAYVAQNIDDFEEDLFVENGLTAEETGILSNLQLEDQEIENYLEKVIDEIDLNELEDIF